MSDGVDERKRTTTGSIAKTLRVLQLVCEHGPTSLKTLSELSSLAPPTILRILRLMEAEGYVTQDRDKSWHGTMLVWRLGCAVNGTIGISSTAQRHTDRLTAELDETSVYAVYDSGGVTYAAYSEPRKPVRAHVRPGQRYPLIQITTGQAVLAWLDDRARAGAAAELEEIGMKVDLAALESELAVVRERGYASGNGVRWPDMWGAAAPVFDPTGSVIGALGVSMQANQGQLTHDEICAAVVAEAQTMTAEIGGREPTIGQPEPSRTI